MSKPFLLLLVVAVSMTAADPPAKLGVFVNGLWFLDATGDFGFDPATEIFGWGSPGDVPVRADWNGDGFHDLTVFSNGTWFVDLNGDRAFDPSTEIRGWGQAGWLPVVGDWNGDGADEIGAIEPTSMIWFRDLNGDFAFDPATEILGWGSPGDVPIVGDWNGDGKDDVGVFSKGVWFIDLNGDRAFDASTEMKGWGVAGWLPVVGDWNGDGADDLGAIEPTSMIWFRDLNGDFAFDPATEVLGWGSPGNVPVVADWNGDGKDHVGVFSNGIWFIDLNGDGGFDPSTEIKGWGEAGWTPMVGRWKPRQLNDLLITDFNPKAGSPGTLITVSGENLGGPGIPVEISLAKLAGGTLSTIPTSTSPTQVQFVLPPGSASGPIGIKAGALSGQSASSFQVTASSTFTLSGAPATAQVIRGQAAVYRLSVDSANGFTQLAALTLNNLPSGMQASISPASITAGQTAVLTLTTPQSQPVASSVFSVTATAMVDGLPSSSVLPLTVDVMPITTSFVGRTVVDDPLQSPLASVTVTMLGKDGNGGSTGCMGSTVSDAAGNFALTNLPANCVGKQLIGFDGLTVTSPLGKYAGVNLVYQMQLGQVTASPVLVHLPRIDDEETFYVEQNAPQDQSYSYTSVPGMSVTVYKNTILSMPDGSQPNPFPLVGVQVPVDRLPDDKPPVPTMLSAFIVAFQPANAHASQPVAVYYPNTLQTRPGVNMTMMTLSPIRGAMVPYGTGTVSPDGRQIIPDFDPAFPGKRYGITDFDWHGPMPPPEPPSEDYPNPPPTGGGDGSGAGGECSSGCCGDCAAQAGEPVDLSSGLQVYNVTDLAINGGRGGISVQRIYRSLSQNNGPFGRGTQHNFNQIFRTVGTELLELVNPDNSRNGFNRQSDGSFINTNTPRLSGAVARVLSDGQIALRYKNGAVVTFQPDGNLVAREISISDRNGNTVTINRDPNNLTRVTSVVDPVGRRINFAYDGNGRVTTLKDPIDRTVSYTYHPSGNLATVTDPAGGVTQYDYDATGRLTQMVDARGVTVFQNEYYSHGRVSRQIQADGGVFRFFYSFLNVTIPERSPILRTSVVDPIGRAVTYRFDPQGFVVQATQAEPGVVYAQGEAANGLSRTIEREPGTNRVAGMIGSGQCAVCGNPAAGSVRYTHDANGNMLTRTDELGTVTKFTYEATFNQVATVQDALGNMATFGYDSRGNLTSTTDARNNTTIYEYDPFGQLIKMTDPLGNPTTYEYDAFGNLTSVVNAVAGTTRFRYDAVSRLVEAMDALGRKSATTYDNLDRVTVQTNAQGGKTAFRYDAVGNLLSVTNARGKTTSFTYDTMSRLLTRTDPLGKTEHRFYDLNGNLTQFIDRRGQTSVFEYDWLDRLIVEAYEDAVVTRSYDAAGRLARVEDTASGVWSYEHDPAGRLLAESGPLGTVKYVRDALGRVDTRQVVGQPAVLYSYDRAGNMQSASLAGASIDFAYDPRNLPSSASRTNGVATQYSFDAAGRLVSIVHTRDNTTLSSLKYGNDGTGQRNSHETSLGQTQTAEPSLAAYNDGDQLVRHGATTYTHDGNGNLMTEAEGGGEVVYGWDSRNRLIDITSPDGSVHLDYDWAGNLVQVANSSGSLTSYIQDDRTNVALITTTADGSAVILSGRTLDTHFAVRTGASVVWMLTDALGSVVATSDQGGNQTGSALYQPFGLSTVVGDEPPFRFTGRTSIISNLYYHRARVYAPQIRRFLSEDPLFTLEGSGKYAYASNSPISSKDPTGLYPEQSLSDLGDEIERLLTENPQFRTSVCDVLMDSLSCMAKLDYKCVLDAPRNLGDMVDEFRKATQCRLIRESTVLGGKKSCEYACPYGRPQRGLYVEPQDSCPDSISPSQAP